MRAFIIHTPHAKSRAYAAAALASFDGRRGWQPQLFDGLTVKTLPAFEAEHPLPLKPLSRAEDFYRERNRNGRYWVKKACSMNHYRLFRQCVELGEPIAVIEHDAHCVADWPGVAFDDVLVMNVDSALRRDCAKHLWDDNPNGAAVGVHDIAIKGLRYRHDPALAHATVMPGLAAYAVTPRGAAKMIDVYETVGWDQGDFLINTAYVRIQTIAPELFTFRLPNLETSHGHNLNE